MGDGTKENPLTFEQFFEAIENCERIFDSMSIEWIQEYDKFIDEHGYNLPHDVIFCSTYLDFTNK